MMNRTHRWIALLAFTLLALHEGTAYAGDYWHKPLRYLLLDALIVTSPLTGIAAMVTAANPRWRERPKRWRTSPSTPSYAHAWLRNHFVMLSTLSALSATGLLVLLAHLMSLV